MHPHAEGCCGVPSMRKPPRDKAFWVIHFPCYALKTHLGSTTGPGISPTNSEEEPESLTSGQLRELSDPEKQEQYRLAYRLQQARRSCSGCGDDVVIF